ncbi:hypothetical protein VP01_2249g1 [Puccinia sorghi]|uniref:Magnesium transporter n=1 Tax=Puccinia sorghi TaxID=27349 RepID=A0A0L6V8E5_9BASI|nr:hypothetical protein VP01_2249g1 [Puccinia sorghi]
MAAPPTRLGSTHRVRSNSNFSARLPVRPSGEENMMRYDAFGSQSIKRAHMSIYYTEISWQGSWRVVNLRQVATRAQFCGDKTIRVPDEKLPQLKDLRLLESSFGAPSFSIQAESIIVRKTTETRETGKRTLTELFFINQINTDGFRALINKDSVAILNDPTGSQNEYQQLQNINPGNEGPALSHRRQFTAKLLKAISNHHELRRRAQIEERSTYSVEYPFELLALGSILDIIFASLEHDHEALRASNRVLLSTLDREISQSLFLHVSTLDDNGSKTMERLLSAGHELQNFIGRCTNLQNCLERISERAATFFHTREAPDSPKTLGSAEGYQASSEVHHRDFLTLIDQYSADETLQEVRKFKLRDLRMKEDTANLVLNSSQLDFVYVGLKLEVLTIGFTLGALLTGTFGMNLKSGLEETDWGFHIGAAVIVTACIVSILAGWIYVKNSIRNF